jgi:hypothetical protein
MRFVALMSGCLVAMLALAGSASASTLAVNQAGVLRLDARFGEVNGVKFSEGSPFGTYVVEDSAGLTAVGPECTQVSPFQGQCLIADATGTPINKVVLDLGNRDDTSTVATVFGFVPVEVDGGFGDDTLSGGAQDGYTVKGGPGDDKIEGIKTNADPIDINGGLGNDTISTSGTFVGGTVRGGFGTDTITLGGDANDIVAATVEGGPGPDVITGGAKIVGPVFGGFGNDYIDLPRASSIDCGFGRDSYGVYEGQTATRCERPLPPPSV